MAEQRVSWHADDQLVVEVTNAARQLGSRATEQMDPAKLIGLLRQYFEV